MYFSSCVSVYLKIEFRADMFTPSQLSELNRVILEMRNMLYGSDQSEPTSEACAKLTQEFFKGDTMHLLIICLPKLDLGVSLLIIYFQFLDIKPMWILCPLPHHLFSDTCSLWLFIALEMFMTSFLICFLILQILSFICCRAVKMQLLWLRICWNKGSMHKFLPLITWNVI